MRLIKFLFTLTLGVCLCVYIGYLTEIQSSCAAQSKISNIKSEILSIEDFQKMLNEIEPGNPIECDGKLGPATQAKWDRIICNQYAAETFKYINHELTRRDTNKMEKYIIAWESSSTGKKGKGTAKFTKKEAEKIVRESNSKYEGVIKHWIEISE